MARTLSFIVVVGLTFCLAGGPVPGIPASAGAPAQPQAKRIVFIAGDLSQENLVILAANIAASGRPGVLLLDSVQSSQPQQLFLAAYHPEHVIPVGPFPQGLMDLERRLDVKAAPALAWKHGPPVAVWRALFTHARRVVVCPAEPRRRLLQAACLSGVLHAPLYVTHGKATEGVELRRWLTSWVTHTVYAVGAARKLCGDLPDVQVVHLKDEAAVAAAHLRCLGRKGAVRNLVVTNPADVKHDSGVLSSLAPWVALHKRAALLLTNEKGDNVGALVQAAVKQPALGKADALLLLADLESIPMERRPNPLPSGKDTYIEMEPLTPTGTAAFSFATGRMFDEDPATVALMLARQKLLADAHAGRKALVISNATGSLPLLETFSRNTAKELHNGGYQTTALFGKDTDKDQVRQLLPEHDIILWEGHYNTLIKDYGLPTWTEPLPPALVVLQSCLALNESKALPLLQRGGIGVIGSSTRIYSASGGAFTLAFFDALMYENESLGSSLRNAKNFLLAYSLLKEKRLGKEAKLGAANLRSAWAFSLWGDPTLHLPAPPVPDDALPPVQHKVHGNTIILKVPDSSHEKAVSARYYTQIKANGRTGGIVKKAADDDGQQMLSFLFAEVHLPNAPPGKTPRLHSRLPGKRWVFCWDARRRAGYLLVVPRDKDHGDLRFHIDWTPQETVSNRKQ
jgi:hypothetical protein